MHSNQTKLTVLLNAYCREFSNWSRYLGIPTFDIELAHYLAKSTTKKHVKIDFIEVNTELYIPLVYSSAAGWHQFDFPAFERNTQTKAISELSPERFLELSPIRKKQATSTISLSTTASPNSHTLTALLDEFAPDKQLPWAIFYIQKYQDRYQINRKQAVQQWLHHYLQLLEYRPQESVLTVDHTGFPESITGTSISTVDSTAASLWIQEVLIDHLFKLIGLIGKHGLQHEDALITTMYHQFSERINRYQDTFASFIIEQRHFKIKSIFINTDQNAENTVANILHENYRDSDLLEPTGLQPVYSKTFPKEQVTVSIRPFNLDADLEMVHRWFHREHARAIWQMDWPLPRLEEFYRRLLAERWGHAYIGEINGIPTFNMEVYWATRDIVGDYYDVLPTDYGTHLFIAPTDKHKKFPSLTMQSIVSWLFEHQKVQRLVGEGAIESMSALLNKVHVGFKLEKIIEMPHKRAHLNFCLREWYWEKFPQNKPAALAPELQENHTANHHLKK